MCTGLDPSLTILFNSTLTSDILLSVFKPAAVRLLLKSSHPDLTENYRPVSLIVIVSQILERIVHSRTISPFLFILIPLVQFAYRTENSTENADTQVVE